jgi:type IV fimbrial biogenesis protein FimT
MRHAHGLTLIELLATIAIVAILSAIAVPSFSNLRHDNARAAEVNGFLHAIFFARSESIKRAQVVTLCKSRDGSSCASDAQWHDGWIVFVNTDRDELPERDPDEELLLVRPGWRSGTITSNRAAYSFRPYRQGVVNGTVTFCDPRGSAHARAIIISHTGRPRTSPRDASNRPLTCPGR